MRRRGGQIWSIDLIIAVVIFLLAIGVFYYFANTKTTDNQSKLEIESRIVANKLTGDDNLSIITDSTVDDTKLVELANMDYETLKSKLGIRGDFCIIFLDQEGNLILINNGTANKTSIGNPELRLNLTDLGETYDCNSAYG